MKTKITMMTFIKIPFCSGPSSWRILCRTHMWAGRSGSQTPGKAEKWEWFKYWWKVRVIQILMKSENIDWYHPYLLWKVNTGRKRQEEIKSESESEYKKVKVLLQRAWKEKRTVWRMGEMTKGGKEVWDGLWVGDDYRGWGVCGGKWSTERGKVMKQDAEEDTI